MTTLLLNHLSMSGVAKLHKIAKKHDINSMADIIEERQIGKRISSNYLRKMFNALVAHFEYDEVM